MASLAENDDAAAWWARQKSAGVNSFAQIKKDLKPYMGQ